MQISDLSRDEGGVVSFSFTLEGEDWVPFLQKASRELQKQRPISGYRTGKAPLPAARNAFGKSLFDRAVSLALTSALPKLMDGQDFAPVTRPSVLPVSADLEQLRAVCKFVDYPRVPDFEYKGIRVEKPVRTCSEKDIDEAVTQYMNTHLDVHEVQRAARMGDIAEVNFTAKCGDLRFLLSHSKNHRFLMGSGQLFAGLDEALVGHGAGDALSLTLTMPEDFHREDIAGRTLGIEVELLGVWERTLLSCTDEYVREHINGCDTVADFRESLRKKIQERYDSDSRRVYAANLDKALAEKVTCPLPAEMVRVALGGFVGTLRQYAASEKSTPEALLARDGKSMEVFLDECRPHAERQVRLSLALDYVVRKEALTVSAQAVDAYIAKLAAANKCTPEQAERAAGGREKCAEELLSDAALKLVAQYAIPVPVETE